MDEWMKPDFWNQVFSDTLEWMVRSAPSMVIILILAAVALRVIRFSLRHLKSWMIQRGRQGGASSTEEIEKRVNTLTGIVATLSRIIVWGMVLMLVLKQFGVDIAPLIAGAGIAGLAIGFGAQELVRDMISGFFMLMENQVRTGDVAIINGTGGLVEDIGLRTITLRDLSGVVHVVQNGKINSLSNMTKQWSAMVFDIGVAYKEDTDKVTEVMRAVSEGMRQDPAFKDLILEPMEIFGVDAFADSAVVIKARFKTRPIQQWNVGREYRRRLKKAFDTAGIEIPFPHRTLYWGAETPQFDVRLKENGAAPKTRV